MESEKNFVGLMREVRPLLIFISEISEDVMSDISVFRTDAEALLDTFKKKCVEHEVSKESVYVATYFLCAAIDEKVLGVSWGRGSCWAEAPLLAQFFNDVTGGERFYRLLGRAWSSRDENIDLIRLAYVLLSFDYRGKYHERENQAHHRTRLKLFQYLLDIKNRCPSSELTVSDVSRHSLFWRMSKWVIFLFLALSVTGVYFDHQVSRMLSPIRSKMESMRVTSPEAVYFNLKHIADQGVMGK